LRAISRLTVEGARPSRLAITRPDSPAAIPPGISSRSATDSARRLRVAQPGRHRRALASRQLEDGADEREHGARISERITIAFDIDHRVALEDGGPDEEWNTQPLCADCHRIKEALRALRRHAEGLSARAAPLLKTRPGVVLAA
jgi:hypothetical protein